MNIRTAALDGLWEKRTCSRKVKRNMNLGMVAYAFNPNFQEAKAGGSQV
jgi:hypothetical protein